MFTFICFKNVKRLKIKGRIVTFQVATVIIWLNNNGRSLVYAKDEI